MEKEYLQVLVDKEGVVVGVLLEDAILPFYQVDVDRQRVEQVEHLYTQFPPKLTGDLPQG